MLGTRSTLRLLIHAIMLNCKVHSVCVCIYYCHCLQTIMLSCSVRSVCVCINYCLCLQTKCWIVQFIYLVYLYLFRLSLKEFVEVMLQYGIVNAVNLDGGGSATYTVNGTLVNYPSDQWYVTFTIHIYFKGRGQSKLQNLCPIPIIYMVLYIVTMKICLFMEILWRINVYSCLNQYESKASNVLTTLSTSGKFNTFQITVNILYFACTIFSGIWFL